MITGKAPKMPKAKVFWYGRNQAVRLPKEFRFQGDEVEIRREGSTVILEPLKRRAWPKGYWQSWGKVPEDFEAPQPLSSSPPDVDLDK
jgi:antitoxin VapB